MQHHTTELKVTAYRHFARNPADEIPIQSVQARVRRAKSSAVARSIIRRYLQAVIGILL
ncbi:hypothetical protein D3C73_1332360 [compost metagenome]